MKIPKKGEVVCENKKFALREEGVQMVGTLFVLNNNIGLEV